jgi:hypothetical protein
MNSTAHVCSCGNGGNQPFVVLAPSVILSEASVILSEASVILSEASVILSEAKDLSSLARAAGLALPAEMARKSINAAPPTTSNCNSMPTRWLAVSGHPNAASRF